MTKLYELESVDAKKRANVEGLNKTANAHLEKGNMKKELDDGQELFIALIEGDDEKILEKLYHYLYGNEYCWAHDGGEPDLEHILAVKLYEKLRGQKFYMSIIYQDVYLKHVGVKYKGKEKEG